MVLLVGCWGEKGATQKQSVAEIKKLIDSHDTYPTTRPWYLLLLYMRMVGVSQVSQSGSGAGFVLRIEEGLGKQGEKGEIRGF